MLDRLSFIALNLLSLTLIFSNSWAAAVAAPLVLLILAWHLWMSRAGVSAPHAVL